MINELNEIRGAKALLVASTGGHLHQLNLISRRLKLSSKSQWVTFDHPQSRSLLESGRVNFIPYIAPRDLKKICQAIRPISQILSSEDFQVVISTGAGVAVPALVTGRAKGIESLYIESVSRFDGPSLSGKILTYVPGVSLFTQHEEWAGGKWKRTQSVLTDYTRKFDQSKEHLTPAKVFVTLGTIKPYRFDSLIERVLHISPPWSRLVWQVGNTTRRDLPGIVRSTLDSDEFDDHVMSADVTITHAGVGSALRILELGRCPVMVPRRRSRGEHVDDHQQQIGTKLSRLGLAQFSEVEDLTWEQVEKASRALVDHL